MKKLLCVILALVTFFTLTSCVSKNNILETVPTNTNTNTDTTAEAKAESEKITESKAEETSTSTESMSQASLLKINGVDISEYKIVYYSTSKSNARAHAEKLAEHIQNAFRKSLEIVIDPESAIESSIIISDTLPNGSDSLTINTLTSVIQYVNGSVWISATNSHSLNAAIDKLIADSTPKAAGSTINLSYSGNKKAIVKADSLGEELKVMTYNVKNGYVTAERQDNTIEDVINFMPDTMGVQEFNLRWFNIFKSKGVFDEYEFVGEQRYGDRDREANDNEYSAILYRKGKFNLIDSGTYWLSETPETPEETQPTTDETTGGTV